MIIGIYRLDIFLPRKACGGHALAGGDFLECGFCWEAGGWVFCGAYAQRLFAYAQYDTPSPRGAPRLGRKDMGKIPVPQALKVVLGMVFCGAYPQRLFAYAHSDGGKRLRSKCGRIKISHPITFWQRFFFLWLRFFLFGRSKKKEMNKTTPYATGYFASFRANGKNPQGRRIPRKIKFRYNLTTFFPKRGIFFLQRLIINIRTNL